MSAGAVRHSCGSPETRGLLPPAQVTRPSDTTHVHSKVALFLDNTVNQEMPSYRSHILCNSMSLSLVPGPQGRASWQRPQSGQPTALRASWTGGSRTVHAPLPGLPRAPGLPVHFNHVCCPKDIATAPEHRHLGKQWKTSLLTWKNAIGHCFSNSTLRSATHSVQLGLSQRWHRCRNFPIEICDAPTWLWLRMISLS